MRIQLLRVMLIKACFLVPRIVYGSRNNRDRRLRNYHAVSHNPQSGHQQNDRRGIRYEYFCIFGMRYGLMRVFPNYKHILVYQWNAPGKIAIAEKKGIFS